MSGETLLMLRFTPLLCFFDQVLSRDARGAQTEALDQTLWALA